MYFDTPKYKVVQRRRESTEMAIAFCETVDTLNAVDILKKFEVTVTRALNWSS